MPDISTKATVGIELNTQPVGRKIAELETKLDKLNEKKRQFEAAGDQKGLVKIQKEINKVSRQLDTARTASERCKAALAKLNESSPKELRHTLKQLKADLDHMERGSSAWKAHVEAIKRVKAEIKTVDAELREHEGLLSRINRKVNEWGMSIASAAAAFTGLVFTARQAVQAYADMEAEMANVRKFTGMTADEVGKLNEAFKGMDTRTSREDLNKLAQEAGRLGLQSQEDVLGFVKAADQINVALDDLGEGATLTLSKLTDIFGDKDRLGVEQSLLAVGSVINELSQNCTASAPYLAQFAQRLAGVGKQANMTIPQIMGFAAVLDSQGQAVEMSATALSQLIMKLFQDPAKIAKATGMDLQKFNKVLKEDTNEALLMLLERLNSLGDISVLAPVFDAMGTDGARASAVIAALAGNIDMVKQQQQAAIVAFKEGTSVTKEYNVQNNTVQANLDKAKKGFHEMAVELGQKLAPAMKYAITGTSTMMRVLSSTISFISDWAATIISTATAIGIYTIAVNASVIADKLKVFWNDVLIASFKKLWATIAANPWGALMAAVGLVIGVVIDLTRRTNALSEAQKALNGIRDEARQKAAEQEQEIRILMAAAQDMNLTYAEQKTAVDKLNKIIPNFNGNIDATTRAFTYSEQALANYNDELVRMYELEGAKAELAELGRKKAKASVKYEQAEKTYQSALSAGEGPAYTTSWGHVGHLGQDLIDHTKIARDAAKAEVDNVAKQEKAILDVFGDALKREAIKRQTSAPIDSPPLPPSGNGDGAFTPMSEKEEKKGQREADAAEKKRKAEEEKKAKQEFKDDIERVKKNLADQNAAALNAYNKGEIDYVTYLDRKQAASEKYYKAAEEVYKKHGLEESDYLAKLKEKQAEEDKKYKEARNKMLKEQYAQERDLAKVAANMEYYNPDNKEAYHNQRVLDEKLAQIDLEYLRKVLKAQTEGSQEYEAARRALEKAERDEELRQRKKLEEDLNAWLYIYSQQGAKKRMDAELLVAKQLYEQKSLLEGEYQEAVAAIQKKYRDEVNSKTGTKAPNQDFDDAKNDYEKQLRALEDYHKQGLSLGEDYESRKFQITQNYHNKIVELVKGEGNEWATMVVTLVETWKAGFEDLGCTLPEKLKAISAMAASAFAVMNAGLQSFTNYNAAAQKLEEKRLDDSIKNGSVKEENKEKELAKIKNKYNKRAQAIEIAQAMASTAMAAINAYASAAAVPVIGHILGPIAASMALAAGAVQIAAIRKSHQAQEQGYYEGGFTGRDPNSHREVGVVHANEFVANHQAVANPQLLPVLRLIDQAQRNNTVGSLTREDVSRAIGQGAILGDMTVAQQRTAEQHDTSMVMVAASMERQTDAINELNARLADGIESFMVMDGERGFDRSWERYQRMKNNPKR